MRHFLSDAGAHERSAFEALLARGEEFRGGASSAALVGKARRSGLLQPVPADAGLDGGGGLDARRHAGHPLRRRRSLGDGVRRTAIVMDGAAAEHVREGAGVLGRYCDMLGVRSFPAGKDYAEGPRASRCSSAFVQHSGVPIVNLESASRHPARRWPTR